MHVDGHESFLEPPRRIASHKEPSSVAVTFLEEIRFPYKNRLRKKIGYPHSILSGPGGPRLFSGTLSLFSLPDLDFDLVGSDT